MTLAELDRKYKIWLFLSVYTLFAFIKTDGGLIFGGAAELAGHFMTAALWLTSVIITMATSRRKIFRSKSVIFLFTGIYMWIIWGAFANFTHITLVSDRTAYGKVLALVFLAHAIFLSARIIEIYDLRRTFMKVNLICFGFILLSHYILYFNGFSFLNSLSSIFGAGQRYRFSYGLGHVNNSGKICIQFMIFYVFYRAIPEEDTFFQKTSENIRKHQKTSENIRKHQLLTILQIS